MRTVEHLLFWLIFPLAIALVRKLFPNKRDNFDFPQTALPAGSHRKYDRIIGTFTVLLLSVLLTICYFLGDARAFFGRFDKLIIFKILPDRFWWVGFGIMFCFGVSLFIMNLVGKCLLKEDFDDYVNDGNLRSGYNSYKAAKFITFLFFIFSIIGFCLLWNYRIEIYNDKIVSRWFLSTKDKTYTYNDIKSIQFINGSTPHFDILFADDMDWNTQIDLHDDSAHAAIKYISKQSGIKIDTLAREHH